MSSLMFEPLRKYATFTGRARRKEYWLFFLFCLVVEIVVGALTGGLSYDVTTGALGPGFALYFLVCLALLIPSLAVSFRRLHDTDRSAWWLLIGFVPIVGAVVLLIFMLLKGTEGPNRYGPDPKAEEPDGAIVAA